MSCWHRGQKNAFSLFGLRILGLGLFLSLGGCVYFNLFYNAKSYFKEGERLLESNPSQAKNKFSKAKEKSLLTIKKYPRSRYTPEALFLVSLAHYYLGEFQNARERFSLFLSLYPRHKLASKAKYYNALAHMKGGDFERGLSLLRGLAGEDRRMERVARFEIYSSLLSRGEANLIIDSLASFITDYPKTKEGEEAIFLLGDAYFSLGLYEASRRYYERYLVVGKDKTKKADALLLVGECLRRDKAVPSETLRSFLSRLSRLDEISLAHKDKSSLLRGKILLDLGEEESALAILAKVKGGKVGAESYFLIGEYYEKKGDFLSSLSYYDTAVSYSPQSEFGREAARKRPLIAKIVQGESLPACELDLARAELYLLSQRDPIRAIAEYEKITRLYPEDSLAPKALYAIGWIKKFILKEADAETVFQSLVNLYPNTHYAEEGRRLLAGGGRREE